MKKVLLLLLTAVMLLSLAACTQTASAGELRSDKPRETAPAVSKQDLAALAEGNSAFAFNLYQVLKETDGNLFYSPYSISAALAMTYGGARGTTGAQMEEALRFLLPQERLHPAFNKMDLDLAQRGQGAKGKDEEGFRLNIVNAIWGQKEYTFLSPYLDLLAKNYGAGLRVLDFVGAPESSRQTINRWVSEQTEERIQDLLPEGAITDLTRLVLTNAIYFNAAWLHPFNEEATADGPFHLLTGQQVAVPMMRQTQPYGYAAGDNYQAVELLYDGRELSMVILLPDTGQFPSFEASLTGQRARDILQDLEYQQVDLTMPRFEFDSRFNLKPALSELGMTEAFTDRADFSGMSGKKDLHISDVVHQAFVSVDEAGTEAAAATGVVVGITSAPVDPVRVTLDRPFIFLIRDIQTDSILFLGRVMNPVQD